MIALHSLPIAACNAANQMKKAAEAAAEATADGLAKVATADSIA